MSLLLPILMATVCLSCSKPLEKSLPGRYHFKMSGNLTFLHTQTCLDDSIIKTDSIGEVGYLLISQSGQMKVIDKGDGYIVNMSVMLGGNVNSFDAVLNGDTLILRPDKAVVGILPEGTSTTLLSTGDPVLLTIGGKGVMYDRTIMFDMNFSGGFSTTERMSGKDYLNEYTVTGSNVICVADKEE